MVSLNSRFSAASSITVPLANRNYSSSITLPVANRNFSSSITPLKKSSRPIRCNNSSIDRKVFPSPVFSIYKKRPPKTICAEESEDGYKVVETPSEFPFKMEDKPGEPAVKLTRRYRGDDIKVIVHMPAFQSSTIGESGDELDDQKQDRHKDTVSDPPSSIRLVLSSTNSLGTTLEYGVIAYPDDFPIDSFSVKYWNVPEEENIYYKETDYVKLDNNLQKEFKRRLKIIGIVPSTTKFLHEYMDNRDMRSLEYTSNSPSILTTGQSAPESIKTTSEYSSNSPPIPTTDQSTPAPTETTMNRGYIFNDEGIPVHHVTEQHRQRGHPLVSAEDIRSRGKNHKDFIYIPYPYTREKLLWVEVPVEGFFASDSEHESELLGEDEIDGNYLVEHKLFLDEGEAGNPNPYRRLPPKEVGDPTVFSEEMDKILYPDLRHMTDMKKAWENSRIILKAHHEEMEKIKYPNGREVVQFKSDLDLELYEVNDM